MRAPRRFAWPYVWGATADDAVWLPEEEADDVFLRAIDVAAPPAHVFAWVAQLRLAPYSYDLLDNFALPSPRRLRDLPPPRVGERAMHLFHITALEPNQMLALAIASPIGRAALGTLWGAYHVVPAASGSRIVAHVAVRYPRNGYGRTMPRWYPLVDGIMFRKQLLRLRAYAEATRESRTAFPA